MNRFKFCKIFCLILSVAAAAYYPVKKIIQYEFQPSELFEFKVTGYDPYDPARGHFLALTVQPENHPERLKNKCRYAVLQRDKGGFADIKECIAKPDGRTCVKLTEYTRQFPFNRFYINEELAPAADRIFFKAVNEKKTCILLVNVFEDGASSVRDLLIDGVSIRKLAADSCQKQYSAVQAK